MPPPLFAGNRTYPLDSRPEHRYLRPELDNPLRMTTTVPRPTPAAAARRAARPGAPAGRVRRRRPLLPTDYLDLVDPLRSGADLRGRIEAVHPETRDAATIVIRPGRGWRPHTPGPVRPHRHRRRRRPPVARLLADLGPDPHRRLHQRHRQGDPRRQGQQPPRAPRRRRARSSSSTRPPVSSCLPDAAPRQGAVRHRRLRHHAGDGHAAQPPRADRRRPGALGARPPTTSSSAPSCARLAADGRIRLVEQHTDTAGMLDAAAIAALVPDLHERSTWACGPVGHARGARGSTGRRPASPTGSTPSASGRRSS